MIEDNVLSEFCECYLVAFGSPHLLDQILRETNFLYLNPGALFLSDETVSHLVFFFDFVKVVNDDTDEQVNDELTANDHKGDEVNSHDGLLVCLRLHTDANCIDSIVHDCHPALRGHHLE